MKLSHTVIPLFAAALLVGVFSEQSVIAEEKSCADINDEIIDMLRRPGTDAELSKDVREELIKEVYDNYTILQIELMENACYINVENWINQTKYHHVSWSYGENINQYSDANKVFLGLIEPRSEQENEALENFKQKAKEIRDAKN